MAEEERGVSDRYLEMVAHNSTPEALEAIADQWSEVTSQAEAQQQAFDYDFSDLADDHGRLDLQAVVRMNAERVGIDPAAYTVHPKGCFLFVCWQTYTGNIPSAEQATQGGGHQERENYYPTDVPVAFNSVGCGTNQFIYNYALLGCGPSAFIGLIGEKYKNEAAIVGGMSLAGHSDTSATSLYGFEQWMVAPTGTNGRPRIAEYMGTCVLGTAYAGFTSINGFVAGINDFLVGTNARVDDQQLVLKYSAGLGGATGFNGYVAGDMIHQQVGMAENPVVATYWPTSVVAHYAAISQYDITWGAGVTINV